MEKDLMSVLLRFGRAGALLSQEVELSVVGALFSHRRLYLT